MLNLIDRLPSHSFTVEAMANDDEYVAASLKVSGKEKRTSAPPLSAETPEVQLLRLVADRIDGLMRVTIKAHGGEPGRGEPLPRPVTAFDRIKAREAEREVDEILAAVLPNGAKPPTAEHLAPPPAVPPARPRDARGRFVSVAGLKR